MKKYIGLALVAFFGTASISTIVAPADHDKKHGKHEGKHQHGAPAAEQGGTPAAPAAGHDGTTQK